MKIKLKKRLYISFLTFIGLLTVTSFNTKSVSATLTSSDDLAALKSAPDGIAVSSFMSNGPHKAFDSKDIYTKNSAQIVDHNGANSSLGNVVSLASGKNTYGAMWSTNNSFNIYQDQTISAWLYFGSGNSSSDLNSEGTAFVLQNDSQGIGALGAGLEGLGVYGYDASQYSYSLFGGGTYSLPTKDYMKNTAIQNSVALEFDTKNNDFYDKNSRPLNNNNGNYTSGLGGSGYYSLDGYDTNTGRAAPSSFGNNARIGSGGGPYGHTALIYPALDDSYQTNMINNPNYDSWDNGFALVHIGSKQSSLIDATDQNGQPMYWHHVTIKWTAPTTKDGNGTLEYNLNDKNLDYSDNTTTSGDNAPSHNSYPVDVSKLNSSDGLVRWGFTGANGPSNLVYSKLVAFDSIPDLLSSDADASITDTTLNNKEITDTSTDKKVANGDQLKLNYVLKYLSGNVNWTSIATKIKIPDNVTLTPDSSGNIATITYSDGATENITGDDNTADGIQHALGKALGTHDGVTATTAKISINATAVNKTDSDINVKKAVAVFSSPTSIASTNSPAFTIMVTPKYSLNLTNSGASDEIDLLYKQDPVTLNLPTTLNYSDNHSFGDATTNTNIIYQITAGGKTYTVGANASGDSFDQNIDLKALINDDDAFWQLFNLNTTNQVTVKAVDVTNGLSSNTLTYTVNTKSNKSLSLTVSKNLEFTDINYGNTSEYLHRKGDFDLTVNSLRSPWTLDVSTDGLYLDGKTLNDNMNLVYKEDSSSPYDTLSSTPTVIDEDTTSHENNYTTDISDDWTKDTGLLLKQNGVSPAGKYTGTLSWTITDSVNTL